VGEILVDSGNPPPVSVGELAGCCLEIFGVRITIACNCSDWLDQLRELEFGADWELGPASPELLARSLEEDDAERENDFSFCILRGESPYTNRLIANGKTSSLGTTPNYIFQSVGNRLHLCIAEFADPEIFVHAGAVLFNGKALVLPGHSYAGKSTLTLALVERGARLLSDDFAVVCSDGCVRAYPIPVSQRSAEGPLRLPARGLGWEESLEPAPLGAVLVTTYESGRKRHKLQELDPAQAILELLQNTVPARRAPARCLGTLVKAVGPARAWRGPRGEAGQMADWLLKQLK